MPDARTWCGVTGCRLLGVRPHGHDGRYGPGDPTPLPEPAPGAQVTLEAHRIPMDLRQHQATPSCWCQPTVVVEHRASGMTLATLHDHDLVHCAECCVDTDCPRCWPTVVS